jgi:hypothetical protein
MAVHCDGNMTSATMALSNVEASNNMAGSGAWLVLLCPLSRAWMFGGLGRCGVVATWLGLGLLRNVRGCGRADGGGLAMYMYGRGAMTNTTMTLFNATASNNTATKGVWLLYCPLRRAWLQMG